VHTGPCYLTHRIPNPLATYSPIQDQPPLRYAPTYISKPYIHPINPSHTKPLTRITDPIPSTLTDPIKGTKRSASTESQTKPQRTDPIQPTQASLRGKPAERGHHTKPTASLVLGCQGNGLPYRQRKEPSPTYRDHTEGRVYRRKSTGGPVQPGGLGNVYRGS
jgi:hypothetical protein